ncbi:MAG: hypothetical protein JWP87_1567 [Labilithrix sp.]|nr:hypothetical protein [Labilithrix sp.]
MSASLLLVVVLVAAGESADASTQAVAPALEQSARRRVSVSLRESVAAPDDAEAARVAADSNVDVVAEVEWAEPAHEHVLVHLRGRDGRLLRTSTLEFAPAEPRAERGRAIGLAIATMLADEPVAAGIVAALGDATAPTRVILTTPVISAPGEPTTSDGPVRSPPDRAAPAQGSDYARFAVEAAGSGAADVRGAATGAGPIARLQWNVARDVGLRIGGAARWFTAGGRPASELGTMAGILWTFARAPLFAAALRTELGVVHDSFTEKLTEMNPRGMVLPPRLVDRSSWAPTVLAGVEGDWRPVATAALFVALNAEASTRTIVGESQAATSPVWASFEGGVRFSF